MTNFLVTGGCGFIGSHLVESLLDDGHYVRVLDDLSTGRCENVPTQCEVVVGDIIDSGLVRDCMQGIDACFHLAATEQVRVSNEQWLRSHQVNLSGTVNVFDASREKCTPVVYASSAAVYGDNAEIPLKEHSDVRAITAYGADKRASELHAHVASLVYGIPTSGMRFFNVYGPRQSQGVESSGVISEFIDNVVQQKPLCIFGDGEQVRDFIHVDDAVHFLRAAMKNINNIPSVFNVCSGDSVTINQLARILISITGLSSPIKHIASGKGDVRVSVGDPAYAKKILSVTATVPLVQGLRKLVELSENENRLYDRWENKIIEKLKYKRVDRRKFNRIIEMPFMDCDGVFVNEDRRVFVAR